MGNTNQNLSQQDRDALLHDDDFLKQVEDELNADDESSEVVAHDADDDTGVEDAKVEAAEPEEQSEKQTKKASSKKATGKKSTKSAKKAEKGDTDKQEEKQKTPKEPALRLADVSLAHFLNSKLGNKVSEFCVVTMDQAEMDDKAREQAVQQFLAEDLDGLAKKVKEKAANVFLGVAGHTRISCYTTQAVKLLKEHGQVSITDIKNHYLSRPYTPGTASAQSSQMAKLLPAIKVARREGNTLVLNEDSALVDLIAE